MKVDILPTFESEKLHLTAEEENTMRQCISLSSEVWSGVIDGELACVWGIVPPTILSDQCYLWLYTTDVIKNHQFVFVRHSQRMVEKILKEYKIIIGMCSISALHSIRWIKWLGGKFGEPQGKYIPFQITRK